MYPAPPDVYHALLGKSGYSHAESCISSWLKAKRNRSKVVLATKVAGPGDFVSHIRGGPRFCRDHITQALDGSLRRLGTDWVDLYQLHWPDRSTNYFGQLGYRHDEKAAFTPLEDTLGILADFVTAGKVRALGVSNETAWGLMKYISISDLSGLPRMASIQNPYNLLNRTFEVGLAEAAIRERCGLLAYSPLAFGVLTGKYLNGAMPSGARLTLFSRYRRYYLKERIQATAELYIRIARRHGLDPAQMALAYVNSRPFLTSSIIGATSIEQLETNIASLNVTLSSDVLEEIEAVHCAAPNPAP